MNENYELPTPEKFWEKFAIEFKKNWGKDPESNSEKFSNNTLWTEKMIDFLYDLGSKMGFKIIDKEYWPRIDVGFFINSEEYQGSDWYKWSFEVAIEHENQVWPAWQEECAKLMVINAGLKVLITYRNDSKEFLKERLEEFKDIYKSRKYHQPNDQWLFIICPNTNIWEKEDFLAYKFYKDTITEITNGVKIFH